MTRSHGLLVVRAWTGGLDAPPFAARVWSTPDVGAAEAVMDLVTSPDAVLAAVRRWLADVLEGTEGSEGPEDAGPRAGPDTVPDGDPAPDAAADTAADTAVGDAAEPGTDPDPAGRPPSG